jgi:hypothetical protein
VNWRASVIPTDAGNLALDVPGTQTMQIAWPSNAQPPLASGKQETY